MSAAYETWKETNRGYGLFVAKRRAAAAASITVMTSAFSLAGWLMLQTIQSVARSGGGRTTVPCRCLSGSSTEQLCV